MMIDLISLALCNCFMKISAIVSCTGKVHRFDRWFLDWTNECKSCLPNTAKAAMDKTATAVKCFIDWTRYVNCSGSMKQGIFGY